MIEILIETPCGMDLLAIGDHVTINKEKDNIYYVYKDNIKIGLALSLDSEEPLDIIPNSFEGEIIRLVKNASTKFIVEAHTKEEIV